MHGRVKVRTTAEQEAKKKKERAEKLAKYKAGISIVFQKRKEKTYDDELLMVSERILLQNPDIYTLWNIRREAFLSNNWDEELMEEFLKKELTFTENCLRENPKSYCIWHQRTWVLNKMREPDWKRELMLCGKCLNLDERNFHCWDYREFVVKRAGITPEEEFEFSTSKILNNFSNYSSWHYRSRLLSKMFQNVDERTVNENKKEELDLVMNATFTDPTDSSAWFYQRWLLDPDNSSSSLWRACVSKDLAVLSFEKDVPPTMSLYINEKEVAVEWRAPRRATYSKIWTATFDPPLEILEEATSIRLEFQAESYSLCNAKKSTGVSNTWIYKSTRRRNDLVNYNEEQLNEQLASYKQLSEMEPENKWALLTGVLLMRRIDPVKFKDDILRSIDALLTVDPLRFNYYNDLRSKYVVEELLRILWESEEENEINRTLDLTDKRLTCLCDDQRLAFFVNVNLSMNSLVNSLYRLASLQSCEKLSLSCNSLQDLDRFPRLPRLRFLSLRNNRLNEPVEILQLVEDHPSLKKLDLRENPICQNESLRELVRQKNPDLELCLD